MFLTEHGALQGGRPLRLSAPGCFRRARLEGLFSVLGDRVRRALIEEASLYPKPGLVDALNSGAHTDMDLATFHKSAGAIAPFMSRFAWLGYNHRRLAHDTVLQAIRPLGLQCEQAMFRATGNINTHRGAIFAFALVCTAVGRRLAEGKTIDAPGIGSTVALICDGMVRNELAAAGAARLSAGVRAYRQHGLTGARGEAESGFATVLQVALPGLEAALRQGGGRRMALLDTLLRLMSCNDDTNLFSRGGAEGLRYVQEMAGAYLRQGSVYADAGLWNLLAMDDDFIRHNLSPGGSADLLAVTLFLHEIGNLFASDGTEAEGGG